MMTDQHGPTSPPRQRVLYVAGWGRSGTTLLGNVLGQVPGLFAAGELRFLGERGLAQRRLCSCGVRVVDCPIWRPVLALAFGSDPASWDEAARVLGRPGGYRHLPLLFTPPALSARLRAATARREHERLGLLERLYHAIGRVHGTRVVVDVSKYPQYGWLLGQIASLDVRVLHVVRDPRAVANSWQRTKASPDRPDSPHMPRYSVASSALKWTIQNAAAEALAGWHATRGLRVRYEDFIDEPALAIRRILELAGEPQAALPDVDGRRVRLADVHAVAGNPNRFGGGWTELRVDDAWLSELPSRRRLVVGALTAPLRRRYGY